MQVDGKTRARFGANLFVLRSQTHRRNWKIPGSPIVSEKCLNPLLTRFSLTPWLEYVLVRFFLLFSSYSWIIVGWTLPLARVFFFLVFFLLLRVWDD